MVDEKTMLVQSNYLVERRDMMTRDENRLFLFLIATVQKDDESLEYNIPVGDFGKVWKTTDEMHVYASVQRAAEGLRSKGITIQQTQAGGKSSFETMSFLAWARYVAGSAYLKVAINPYFKPHLLRIKNNFTKYHMKDVIELDAAGASVPTIRIYELCCEWLFAGTHSFSILDLKDKLELYTTKNGKKRYKYPDNTDFKRYIMKPAIDAINQVTGLSVSYEIEGKGVTALVVLTIGKKPLVEEVSHPDQGDGAANVPELPAAPDEAPAPAQDEPLDDQRIAGSRCNPDPDSDMVDWCADSFKAFKPHGVEFTRAEMKLMMKAAGKWLPAGDDLAMMDYFDAQADYITDNWQRIRSKKAYIKRAVKENYAEFEP